MSLPVLLALFWLIGANLRALFPSKDNLWRFAYVMIALGVPILIWLIYAHGPWAGLVFVLASASLLRWPLVYLFRWLKKSISND